MQKFGHCVLVEGDRKIPDVAKENNLSLAELIANVLEDYVKWLHQEEGIFSGRWEYGWRPVHAVRAVSFRKDGGRGVSWQKG